MRQTQASDWLSRIVASPRPLHRQPHRSSSKASNALPTPSLMDPSIVAEYLAMKRLIDEGFLTVPLDTIIRVRHRCTLLLYCM